VVLGLIGFCLPGFENKIISIAYKSIVLSLVYVFVIYRLKIAVELQSLITGFFKKEN